MVECGGELAVGRVDLFPGMSVFHHTGDDIILRVFHHIYDEAYARVIHKKTHPHLYLDISADFGSKFIFFAQISGCFFIMIHRFLVTLKKLLT